MDKKSYSEIIGKPVIINCPNSRWNGHVGYITDCFMEASYGFEVLYTVRIHSMLRGKQFKGADGLVYACKADMAIDEIEFAYASF